MVKCAIPFLIVVLVGASLAGAAEPRPAATANPQPTAVAQPAPAKPQPTVAVNTGEVVTVAKKWLVLADAGKYEESWSETAAFVRKAVTKEQWSQGLGRFRGRVGTLKSRVLRSVAEMAVPPGAPEGQFVAVDFDSSFSRRAGSVEIVQAVLEPDGHWRVVGYSITEEDALPDDRQ